MKPVFGFREAAKKIFLVVQPIKGPYPHTSSNELLIEFFIVIIFLFVMHSEGKQLLKNTYITVN